MLPTLREGPVPPRVPAMQWTLMVVMPCAGSVAGDAVAAAEVLEMRGPGR
ncbi:hypothetical protein IMZ48_37790 [Candidatus Bathyarchaeota archaeon]|nr:hypothetical protein [Candidatus Bathyarchaeota archaeon]